MALQIKTDDDRSPGQAITAYAKVIGIHGERFKAGKGQALVTFAYFASADAAQAEAARIGAPLEIWTEIDLSQPVHPQAYAALKAHDPVTELVPVKAAIELRAMEQQQRIDELQARLDSGSLDEVEVTANEEAMRALVTDMAAIDEERDAFGPKYEIAETFRARLQAAQDV